MTLFTMKKILRRQLPLGETTFIAGDMDVMHGAMQQLRIPVPVPNDYPACLKRYLHRHVWRSTLGDVERRLMEGDGHAVFVKPAERRKSFTGRAFSVPQDFEGMGHLSRRQEVWCAELVAWRSEYRVYVIGAEIVAIAWYEGDRTVSVDRIVVEAALADYGAAGEAPAAYAIDFGVLETGETALVEANDGYSVGAYEIAPEQYAEMVQVRWRELLGRCGTAE